jgi:multidrug efflux system outer membrane protein
MSTALPGANLSPARALCIALCSLSLAACVNLTPDYTRPALPVAKQFEATSLTPTTAASALPHWPAAAFFADPKLKPLLEMALQNNRDLRLAALNIELAQAQLGVRQADLLPTVNIGLTGSRLTTAAGGISSTYTTGLSVAAYEVDLFQRLRNLSDVARAQYLATQEARKTVHISLLASVASTYLAWQSDIALLDLTRQTIRTREATLKLLQLRFDKGASSLIDLRAAESLLASAQIAMAQLRRQQQQDENTLTLLVGQPIPGSLLQESNLQNAYGQVAALEEMPAGLSSDVLLRRPDVAQAELLLQASNANIGAARAAFFPKITLTGSLGLASSDLANLFKNGLTAWSFAPQILQPLWDAGRNESNLQIAQTNRAIAQAQYEKTVQSAFKEVADAFVSRATLKDQWTAQKAQTQAEQERAQLAQLRYKQGVNSYLDALDAERAAFTAQQALIQIQTQYAQNRVTLYRALGGGWTP